MADTTLQKRTEEETRYQVIPKVDVYENEEEYLVIADVPGVSQDHLNVSFVRGELTLEGTNGDRVYRRAFTVPDGIDGSSIEAKMVNGVLSIHLPKAPEVKPRRIQVRSA